MSLFSRRGGTLHLPLRSVVIDRVTGGPARGSFNAEEERECLCKEKDWQRKRDSNGEKRGRRKWKEPRNSQEGNVQRWEG